MDHVARPGFTLCARESGLPAGAPVLLLSNSLGTTHAMWAPQLPALERRFRVLTYDTRGHGASRTPPGPYSFDDLVADAIAVLDHYEVRRASFMGLSLGGMTGMGIALAHPDRLERLVVCDARADAPEPFVRSWDDRVAAIRRDGLAAIWSSTAERWFVERTRAEREDLIAFMRAGFLETTVEGYCGCAAALKGLSYLSQLTDIRAPTLYVVGEKDTGAPPAAMREMASVTPSALYVEIPGAAHLANLDAPIAFEAAVESFFEEAT